VTGRESLFASPWDTLSRAYLAHQYPDAVDVIERLVAEISWLRDALAEWERVSPVHRYECGGLSGCSCGLDDVRELTRTTLRRRGSRDEAV